MSLNFKYTCKDIDKNKNHLENIIETNIDDLIQRLNPDISKDDRNDLVLQYGNYIIQEINESLEEVRALNSDLRDEAEKTIEEYKKEIKDLENELEQLRESFVI